MELRWSPSWMVEPAEDGSTLVLSAGADRRVAVDGVDPAARDDVERWQAKGCALPADDGHLAPLADRLVELGVLVPTPTDPAAPPSIVGDPTVTRILRESLKGCVGGSDLVVAVRTGRAWPDRPEGCLHLGIDLALHHTVVLGPLVVPGASACLQCVDERMAYRWPTPAVPPEPAVLRSLAVAGALLRIQVELVAAGTSPLVNATIAWDLERGTVDRQRVYKMVGCERCDMARSNGRVKLGWEAQ